MEPSRRARVQLLTLLALGGVLAAPLALPAAGPLALLAWLSLLAAPAGALLAQRLRGWSVVAALTLLAALTWVSLPQAASAPFASTLAALLALGLLGAALAAALRARGVGLAAQLVLLGALLAALPSLGGLWRGAPWPPPVAARLLDLSPLSLTAESAGLDWMRHSFVYEAAGTASIGPELRSAWGALAGPVCFVVGCALLLVARATERRARGQEGPLTDR